MIMMKIYTFTFLICLLCKLHGHCKSDISLGFGLSLVSPVEYTQGFMGKAYIMETESSSREPGFKAALTMESSGNNDSRYLCSLQVFLGDVKVWSSGHYSKMYVSNKCIFELAKDGDLRLKSSNKHVGWRSGTSGQGVERLEIQKTGNLVLLDGMNLLKWQSFNFPTDVMLSGQRLDVATQLTSYPKDSTLFYSFEVLRDKIALFLNSNKLKYSYWEYKPRIGRIEQTVNFVRLGSKGLDLFDDNSRRIGRIEQSLIRFLAIGNKTGNLGLYSYKPEKGKFEATFQAVSNTCDLPVACKPYGICTFSKSCSCIKAVSNGDCSGNEEEAKRLCDHEMVELQGATTVLRNGTRVRNVSKEGCEELCKKDCECRAASYSVSDECCDMYGIVMGVKQIERVSGLSYMVKIPKGVRLGDEKSNVRKWVVGLVGGIDGFVILLLLSGFAFYFIRKRRKSSSPPQQEQPNTDLR